MSTRFCAIGSLSRACDLADDIDRRLLELRKSPDECVADLERREERIRTEDEYAGCQPSMLRARDHIYCGERADYRAAISKARWNLGL